MCLAYKIICLLCAVLSRLQPLENPSACGSVAEHFSCRALRLRLVPAYPKRALSRKYPHKHFRKGPLNLQTHKVSLPLSQRPEQPQTKVLVRPENPPPGTWSWLSQDLSPRDLRSFADWCDMEKLSCHQLNQCLMRSQVMVVTVFLSFLLLQSPSCTWFALAALRAGTEVTRVWCERLQGILHICSNVTPGQQHP